MRGKKQTRHGLLFFNQPIVCERCCFLPTRRSTCLRESCYVFLFYFFSCLPTNFTFAAVCQQILCLQLFANKFYVLSCFAKKFLFKLSVVFQQFLLFQLFANKNKYMFEGELLVFLFYFFSCLPTNMFYFCSCFLTIYNFAAVCQQEEV